MLVAENSRRSRLRVLYGILAQSALEQFDAPQPEMHRRAYFENLSRLLEMYRYDTIRRPSPRAILDRRRTNLRQLKEDKNESVAVERALETAHKAVYDGWTRQQLAEHLQDLFSRVARDETATLGSDELAKAKSFLEEFAAALER